MDGVREQIEEPEQVPPWRPENGPQPRVWCWPSGDRPALYVYDGGKWKYAP